MAETSTSVVPALDSESDSNLHPLRKSGRGAAFWIIIFVINVAYFLALLEAVSLLTSFLDQLLNLEPAECSVSSSANNNKGPPYLAICLDRLFVQHSSYGIYADVWWHVSSKNILYVSMQVAE